MKERLIALLIAIPGVVAGLFEQLDEQDIMEKIISNEQVFEKIRLLINSSGNNPQNTA